ncbi:MAG: nucleotidyltransferase domain-containing protein [Acidobacteria bacterium]|nr:nucleotidyltransferase domain-containing protein [Acidobacteriota bacterium]
MISNPNVDPARPRTAARQRNAAAARASSGPRGAAAEFAAALRERYGDALVDARLFGSCARGEMREDSDVDVAVVLEQVDWRTRRDVIDLSADVGLAHDVLLSATVLDRETLERWRRQERALVLDIERDGLPL